MSKRKVEAGPQMVSGVTLGGKPVRGVKNPLRRIPIQIDVLEVESSIDAGFRMQWGTVDVDGDTLEISSGAGLGSSWATISFRGKHYAIGAHEIVEAFLQAVEEQGSSVDAFGVPR